MEKNQNGAKVKLVVFAAISGSSFDRFRS